MPKNIPRDVLSHQLTCVFVILCEPQPASLAYIDFLCCLSGLATNSIFFFYHFVKTSLTCLEGKNDSSLGKILFFFLRSFQRLPLRPLGDLFELTQLPSKTLLNLAYCIASRTSGIEGCCQVHFALGEE